MLKKLHAPMFVSISAPDEGMPFKAPPPLMEFECPLAMDLEEVAEFVCQQLNVLHVDVFFTASLSYWL